MTSPQSPEVRPNWVVVCAGVLFLAAFIRIALSPHQLLYDEGAYMGGAALLSQSRFDSAYLRSLPVSAGPLYDAVHWLCSPITHFEPPAVRLVSLAFLAISLALLARSFRQLSVEHPTQMALLMLGVPFVWVSAAMALTEVPPLPFLIGSLLLAHYAGAETTPRRASLATALLSGLLLGLAFSGRQPLIVVGGPLFAYLLYRRRVAGAVLLAFGALPIPLALVIIWQGLVPPKSAYVGEGLSLLHGCLSLAYAGVALVFTNPRALRLRKEIWAFAILSGLLIAFAFGVEYPAAMTLAAKLLPPSLQSVWPRLAFAVLWTLAVAFVAAMALWTWDARSRPFIVAVNAALLLLLLANAKVTHQFSSRYVVPALPLLLIGAAPERLGGRGTAARMLLGAALGFASLETYFRLG